MREVAACDQGLLPAAACSHASLPIAGRIPIRLIEQRAGIGQNPSESFLDVESPPSGEGGQVLHLSLLNSHEGSRRNDAPSS